MNKLDTNSNVFFRRKVITDVADKAPPFNRSLVSYSELKEYLVALVKQFPEKDIPVDTWRLKEVYRVLREIGGVHLRYNATVNKKTVNLNMWVMWDHERFLAMPRGELIREWKRASSGKT